MCQPRIKGAAGRKKYMYVSDHMTKDPITISKDTVISAAIDLMRKNDFHRLPVVDGDGRLIGLVTRSLVEESSGKQTTSLSIFELNYLLSRTKVEDIMIEDVKTIAPDVFVEEAAQDMIDYGVGVLPVTEEDGRVIGIITEKDIFQVFTELLGYRHEGTRFAIYCEDRPGFFSGIARCFAENNANLESLAVYHTKERGTEAVVKATGEISVRNMIDTLKKAGFKLTAEVVQTTKFGTQKRYEV